MSARHSEDPLGPTPMGIYNRLHEHYGELDWWPAEGPFQVMVGAVLTQRTAWRNVELAIILLEGAGVNDMYSLTALPIEELEVLIRPSGTYRQKAQRLHDLFTMVQESPHSTLDAFLDRPVDELRQDLLSVKGIGPETADSIILYAAEGPAFVVDAYTRRVLERIGIRPGASYDILAAWFTAGITIDVNLYNNYHATIVEVAKEFCRKKPVCQGCPLAEVCNTGRGASVIPRW